MMPRAELAPIAGYPGNIVRTTLPFKFVFLLGCARLATQGLFGGRLLGRLAEWTTAARLPSGHTAHLRPFSDDPIAVNEVHNWRSYESFVRLREGQIVLDVGAHIGAFALRASKFVGPSGLVIAIEPEPENFRLLVDNCALNHAVNIRPYNIALSSSPGTRKLRVYGRGRTMIHSIEDGGPPDEPQHGTGYRSVEVDCETLDSLSHRLGLKKIDVIKIDVEGHEISLLEGGIRVLENFRPDVVVEPSAAMQERVRTWFTDHGYTAWRDAKFPWLIQAHSLRAAG